MTCPLLPPHDMSTPPPHDMSTPPPTTIHNYIVLDHNYALLDKVQNFNVHALRFIGVVSHQWSKGRTTIDTHHQPGQASIQ